MPIDRIGPDPLRPPDPRPARGTYRTEGEGTPPLGGTEAVSRADRVEISEEGRLLAARLDQASATTGGEVELPEWIQSIRAKIAEGAYDTPEVIEDVARKLIASGDLRP